MSKDIPFTLVFTGSGSFHIVVSMINLPTITEVQRNTADSLVINPVDSRVFRAAQKVLHVAPFPLAIEAIGIATDTVNVSFPRIAGEAIITLPVAGYVLVKHVRAVRAVNQHLEV